MPEAVSERNPLIWQEFQPKEGPIGLQLVVIGVSFPISLSLDLPYSVARFRSKPPKWGARRMQLAAMMPTASARLGIRVVDWFEPYPRTKRQLAQCFRGIVAVDAAPFRSCPIVSSSGVDGPRSFRLRPVVGWLLLVLPTAFPGDAQFGRFDNGLGSEEHRREAEPERLRILNSRYEARRARAHARLGRAANSVDLRAQCPAFGSPAVVARPHGKGEIGPFRPRAALRPSAPRWSGVAPDSESAAGLFLEYLSEQVVQARCVNCHVEGGVSGHTRLVLNPATVGGHEALNLAVFEHLVATVDGAVDLILNKIRGVGHGGGVQVPAGSAEFANMERFLRLLSGDETSGGWLSPETIFEGVTMASPRKTLRRAALIFAGRLPTQSELDAVRDGQDSSLRRTIRNLMTGPGFHEFLIRASNDRLLTDRHLDDVLDFEFQDYLVDLANKNWEMAKAAIDGGYESPSEDPSYRRWERAVTHGVARAPLELIAHVVENDLPYTEILTADYIMANPLAARAYGAATEFDNPNDAFEFRPSEIVSYYRNDDSKIAIRDEALNAHWIANPGNLATDYPHAGILNTTVFLLRYPTTATNRNRARSRWTYYHFLGLDIEKSASRTTDPVALADTDNPTMKNPACTVCHQVMDPVAGAYQNYGEEGMYRDAWGGLDSLAQLYKHPEDGSESPYRRGDTWYRDMREPGFGSEHAPNADNSLQWLAKRMAADPRFAEATVKFWWPALMGAEVLTPPEDDSDADFQARLAASTAQLAEVRRLASAFRQGIAGGRPYNGRDLLAELALTQWFRADSAAEADPVRDVALAHAGVERLLTPEELERKTEAITGYVWGRQLALDANGRASHLNATRAGDSLYELMYGGIDSDGITVRADDVTPLIAAVAQRHAIEISCPVVQREFYLMPDESRRLFGGIDRVTTPLSEVFMGAEITAESWAARQTVSVPVSLAAGPKAVRLAFTNDFWDPETRDDRNLFLVEVVVRDRAGSVVDRVELRSLPPQANQDCNHPREADFALHCEGTLNVAVSIPAEGDYEIDVVAWQESAGNEPARLEIVVESDGDSSRGAKAIKSKLAELHDTLFGVTVTADSPDVEASYQLFREVWERKRNTEGSHFDEAICDISDSLYFESLARNAWEYNRWGHSVASERGWDVLHSTDRSDPYHVARTWVVVLAALLSDYRYLYF